MKKILVTGFDPFGGEKINPALEVIKLLPKKIEDNGIKFMIATGRPYLDARHYRDSLELKSYLITSNGARAHDEDNNPIVVENIPKEYVKRLLAYNVGKGIHRNIYLNDDWIIEYEIDGLVEFHKESGYGFNIDDLSKYQNQEVAKVFFLGENKEIEDLEKKINEWKELYTDDVSAFDKYIKLDVSNLVPQVTWGTNPEMGMNITDNFPEIKDLNYEKAYKYMDLTPGDSPKNIDLKHVFIGSCTNGRLSDLEVVAKIVKGKKVHPNIKAVIVPGSQIVKKQAEEKGFAKIFLDAGFEWREAGCSTCLGMNPDLIPSGEHCASTSNRNFEGRQGKGARTHLVSPAMAAAAAIYGHFIDIRELKEVQD